MVLAARQGNTAETAQEKANGSKWRRETDTSQHNSSRLQNDSPRHHLTLILSFTYPSA